MAPKKEVILCDEILPPLHPDLKFFKSFHFPETPDQKFYVGGWGLYDDSITADVSENPPAYRIIAIVRAEVRYGGKAQFLNRAFCQYYRKTTDKCVANYERAHPRELLCTNGIQRVDAGHFLHPIVVHTSNWKDTAYYTNNIYFQKRFWKEKESKIPQEHPAEQQNNLDAIAAHAVENILRFYRHVNNRITRAISKTDLQLESVWQQFGNGAVSETPYISSTSSSSSTSPISSPSSSSSTSSSSVSAPLSLPPSAPPSVDSSVAPTPLLPSSLPSPLPVANGVPLPSSSSPPSLSPSAASPSVDSPLSAPSTPILSSVPLETSPLPPTPSSIEDPPSPSPLSPVPPPIEPLSPLPPSSPSPPVENGAPTTEITPSPSLAPEEISPSPPTPPQTTPLPPLIPPLPLSTPTLPSQPIPPPRVVAPAPLPQVAPMQVTPLPSLSPSPSQVSSRSSPVPSHSSTLSPATPLSPRSHISPLPQFAPLPQVTPLQVTPLPHLSPPTHTTTLPSVSSLLHASPLPPPSQYAPPSPSQFTSSPSQFSSSPSQFTSFSTPRATPLAPPPTTYSPSITPLSPPSPSSSSFSSSLSSSPPPRSSPPHTVPRIPKRSHNESKVSPELRKWVKSIPDITKASPAELLWLLSHCVQWDALLNESTPEGRTKRVKRDKADDDDDEDYENGNYESDDYNEKGNYENGNYEEEGEEEDAEMDEAELHSNTLDQMNWDQRFEQLKKFKAKYNHCNVPYNWTNKALARWVYRQKDNKKAGKLLSAREKKLNSIGFDWAPKRAVSYSDRWDQRIRELEDFKHSNHHCRVPNVYPPNQQLSNWVRKQREKHKGKTLTHDRYVQLSRIGFVWECEKTR